MINTLRDATGPHGLLAMTIDVTQDILESAQRDSSLLYQSLTPIIRGLLSLISRKPSLWDCATPSGSGPPDDLGALYRLLTQVRDELLKISGRAEATACFTNAQDEDIMKSFAQRLRNARQRLENMSTKLHVDPQQHESAKTSIAQKAVKDIKSSPVTLGSLEVNLLSSIKLPSSLRIEVVKGTMFIPDASSEPLLNVLHKPPWRLLPDQDLFVLQKQLGTLLVRVAHGCDCLPSALKINTVKLLSRHHVACGGYADIYQGLLDGTLVALKRFRIYSDRERETLRERFCKEVVLWQSLNHRHVLPFYGLDECSFRPHLCMISPWMSNGNVLEYTMRHNLPASAVNRLLLQAIDGLEYLHNKGVVHGDLRCANIFVNRDNEACLADFGLAIMITDSGGLGATSSQGSHRWNAPELYRPDFKHRTVYTDIYAFGATCLELHTRQPPFAEMPVEMAVACAIMRGERPAWPSSARLPHNGGSVELWSIVEQCWWPDPGERPLIINIKEILSQLSCKDIFPGLPHG